MSLLCKLAGVSRSGYYVWLESASTRQRKDEQDEMDVKHIKFIFQQKKEKVGALQIKMILENDYFLVMNHKKIRRLMRKYRLITSVRKANPYKKMIKATQEHRTCPNHLNREFNQEEPGKVMLTDITYLYYSNGQKAYLSCVKDSSTNEILAHYLSTSLDMDLVQGVHYTNPVFQDKIKKLGITQSMSRKGNCWDNAPMESFFGHFKDEVDYKDCNNLGELKQIVDSYIDEYNNHRYQWGLKKMTPAQYRGHLLAA